MSKISARRGHDRGIAGALIVAILGSVGFMLAYGFHAGTQLEGLAFSVAVLGFLFAALGWSRWIIPGEQVVDEIDEYPSPLGDRSEAVDSVVEGSREVTRRSLLTRLLVTALGFFGIATLFPIRSLGPAPDGTPFRTKWKRGSLVVRETGEPVTRETLNPGSVVTIFPEGAIGDAQSQAVLIRLPGEAGAAAGYVAYSKVCTHAGCPVALYRASAQQLMCPCHQSIFDAANAGRVLAGPADHALPQLPIEIDSKGRLRATGDFPVPIGPGFWGRA